jgi:hypothetical protein
MKNLFLIALGIALFLSFGVVYAENQSGSEPAKSGIHSIQIPVVPVNLKPGPGLDKVSTLCNICHSTDYITMQPPFPRGTWTAEVNKMIKVMGAPINEEDAKTIIDYLATNYGTGN